MAITCKILSYQTIIDACGGARYDRYGSELLISECLHKPLWHTDPNIPLTRARWPMDANREYKSTVFTGVFSEKESLIELWNALSGGNYSADTSISINTLDNVLFMGKRNDISFTIDGKTVVLVEHQSSISENLPLRFLLYIARVYEKIVDKRAVYRYKQVMIPTPEFVVLYNGKADFPDEVELKLSDAFHSAKGGLAEYGGLELIIRVLNINTGHNDDIVGKCATLQDYMTFVNMVRDGIERGLGLDVSVRGAVKYCQDHGILQPFLTEHSSEVLGMLFTEFNIDDAKEIWQEEAFEDGVAFGEARGEANVIKLLESGMSLDEIKDIISKKHDNLSQ